MISKVLRWGNSLAVRIPGTFAEEIGLTEDSSVEISVQDGRMVVAPVKPVWRLNQLISGISPANIHGEIS